VVLKEECGRDRKETGWASVLAKEYERMGRVCRRFPFWEWFGYTPVVFVRVANTGLTGTDSVRVNVKWQSRYCFGVGPEE